MNEMMNSTRTLSEGFISALWIYFVSVCHSHHSFPPVKPCGSDTSFQSIWCIHCKSLGRKCHQIWHIFNTSVPRIWRHECKNSPVLPPQKHTQLQSSLACRFAPTFPNICLQLWQTHRSVQSKVHLEFTRKSTNILLKNISWSTGSRAACPRDSQWCDHAIGHGAVWFFNHSGNNTQK